MPSSDSTGNVIDLVKDQLPELQLSEEDRQKNLELLEQAKKVSDRFLMRRGRRSTGSLSESPTGNVKHLEMGDRRLLGELSVYNIQVDQSDLWLAAMHEGVLLNSCQSPSGSKAKQRCSPGKAFSGALTLSFSGAVQS